MTKRELSICANLLYDSVNLQPGTTAYKLFEWRLVLTESTYLFKDLTKVSLQLCNEIKSFKSLTNL